MLLRDIPIQKKLMIVILLISGTVSLLTCIAFLAYETFTFRQTTLNQLSTLGKIIASNSTAALAFQSEEDANDILKALKAEPHITAACIYDDQGEIFAKYPMNTPDEEFPRDFKKLGYEYKGNFLEGFQPVKQGDLKLGTVFIKSDLEAIYQRFRLYGTVVLIVIVISFLLAYALSRKMQKEISKPILTLAETAKTVSENNDYSVRAKKYSNDELGLLTSAFNKMLAEIQQQNHEIKSLNQGLEQKVKGRTKELKAVNKELEAFTYSVSHDLRAPLRIINGYMNIFLEDYGSNINEEGKNVANIILNNANKMGQLIDDLLEFSRLGRKELTKSRVSMGSIVNDVWESLKKSEKDRSLELKMHELPEAYAEYATICQVWANLISNAIKYTRNQSKAVIEIGCEDRENIMAYYIKDNGAGFNMKYYDKLFGVFQRLHSPSEFEGTGVGLALVQRIITKHGGKIWADSKPNEGATFYFTLNGQKTEKARILQQNAR